MKTHIKKHLQKFIFSTVIILCISVFVLGIVTVKEKGEYNMYLTRYAVMSFSDRTESLEAQLKDNRLKINIPLKKIKNTIRRYICFSPLSLPFYLFKDYKSA